MGRRSSPVLGLVCAWKGGAGGQSSSFCAACGGCLEMFNSPGLERNLNSLPQEQRQTKVGHYDIKVFSNLVHSLILWEGNLNFFQGVVPAGEDLES